jgi:hypothetical protein
LTSLQFIQQEAPLLGTYFLSSCQNSQTQHTAVTRTHTLPLQASRRTHNTQLVKLSMLGGSTRAPTLLYLLRLALHPVLLGVYFVSGHIRGGSVLILSSTLESKDIHFRRSFLLAYWLHEGSVCNNIFSVSTGFEVWVLVG